MSSPAVAPALTEAAWLDQLTHRDELIEVVDGSFVVERVGGNPHHRVARLLANAFEEQWADCVATAPGNWILKGSAGGIELARMPDVLVDGDGLLQDSTCSGPASAAVEVWSPGNSLEEMNGNTPLQVSTPRPFHVVPNALLRR